MAKVLPVPFDEAISDEPPPSSLQALSDSAATERVIKLRVRMREQYGIAPNQKAGSPISYTQVSPEVGSFWEKKTSVATPTTLSE